MKYVKVCAVEKDNYLISDAMSDFGLRKQTIELLFSRNINSKELISKFLNPKLSDLNNPFLLDNMNSVCQKIVETIKQKKKIVVFGDYDVDGISATYILVSALKKLGADVGYFLPHRIDDGYGLTEKAIRQVKNKFSPDLIITVDCGISCYSEIELAKTFGAEVIVTDHHDIPSILPNCLIINPKMSGQKYPYDKLCGAGVALKLAEALLNRDKILEYLPVCAIATISDIVSLTGENRVIVKQGLSLMKKYLPVGIKALAEKSGIEILDSQSIAFKLAPKINAPGRMGNSTIALKLFFATEPTNIQKLVNEITEFNLTRQNIGNGIFDDAKLMLNKENLGKARVIILKDNEWEQGILGLASAKLCNEYNRPTILFSKIDTILKGSCRSIRGINIMDALKTVEDLIENYGGHEMAAGLAIKEKNYTAFKERLNAFFNKLEFEDFYEVKKEYDIETNCGEVDESFLSEFELLEPTGCDNKAPIFKLEFDKCQIKSNNAGMVHVFGSINDKINLIAFNGVSYYCNLIEKNKKSALVEFNIETYRHKRTIKSIVKAINFSEFNKDVNVEQALYFKQLLSSSMLSNNIKKVLPYNLKSVVNLKNKLSNLFVTYDLNKGLEFSKNNNIELYKYNLSGINGESAIIYCPLSYGEFKDYANIIFLEPTLDTCFISDIPLFESKTFFELDEHINNEFLKTIFSSREELVAIYKILQNISRNNAKYINVLEFYKANFQNKCSLANLFLCLAVFKQLDFIEINENEGFFEIKTLNSNKKNLEDSTLFNKIISITKK